MVNSLVFQSSSGDRVAFQRSVCIVVVKFYETEEKSGVSIIKLPSSTKIGSKPCSFDNKLPGVKTYLGSVSRAGKKKVLRGSFPLSGN